MNTKVEIKSRKNGKAVIAGYGVVFEGEDLYGETFTKSTDLMLDLVPEKPVLFNHGIPVTLRKEDMSASFSIKNFLGAVSRSAMKFDENGLFIEAVLDESQEYVAEVLELIEQGVIGWSSGSIGHLVEMDGKNIKRWPIVEFSLTHTPAEPRTLGVEHLRGLLEAVGDEEVLELVESTKPDTQEAVGEEDDDIETEKAVMRLAQATAAAAVAIARSDK